jgi:tRNA1Val (adenine37-N6)-methyltransferase
VITTGHLLGGRVLYRQPTNGFRSGIEPVLLAASVPVRSGESVLEAGTGAGAALMCLSARITGLHATGVEIDPATANFAAANAEANGFRDIKIIAGSIESAVFPHPFEHAITNPPYHATDGTKSPNADREKAKRGSETLMAVWIGKLSGALRNRGSLTLIVPAGMVLACLAAMTQCRCPCTVLFPFWPKAGRKAKLVLLRGVKNARTPMRLAPGLILHDPDGSFTAEAQAILGGGAALPLDC